MDTKIIEKLLKKKEKLLDMETEKLITWCSGCGNYGIQNALMRALVLEDMERNDFALFFDVGCSGNGSDKIEANTFHGLHGRAISLAAGAALANTDMKCIAFSGDGATFSEGINHLVHGLRNNYPMIFVMHNNENFGLTTGQASALTRKGTKMNSSPTGTVVPSINSIDLVLSCKPSFVARGYSGDVDQMTEIFREAIKHDGFAYIEMLQACPTYNRATPDAWYAERVRRVEDLDGYDRSDIWAARKLAQDVDENIYTGILYTDESRDSFMVNRKETLVNDVGYVDIVSAFL